MTDDGLIISDTYMPMALIVGTGTTPADKTDTALETKIGAVGAVEFPLARVDVNDNITKYGTGPIYVGFEFDIPSGAINGEVTPYTITEWGMIAGDGTGATLLARKVGDLIKHFNLSVTVRWEIRV
jgi:hypothetical protein